MKSLLEIKLKDLMLRGTLRLCTHTLTSRIWSLERRLRTLMLLNQKMITHMMTYSTPNICWNVMRKTLISTCKILFRNSLTSSGNLCPEIWWEYNSTSTFLCISCQSGLHYSLKMRKSTITCLTFAYCQLSSCFSLNVFKSKRVDYVSISLDGISLTLLSSGYSYACKSWSTKMLQMMLYSSLSLSFCWLWWHSGSCSFS